MTLTSVALEDLRQLLTQGVSLMLVTRDERLTPELTRAAAARLGDDGLLRLALPLPESRRAIWNLETNPVIALSATLPTTYRSLQVKGRDVHTIEWPGHAELARAHADAFRDEVIRVGVAAEIADSFFSHRRYVTIGFTPSELYEQTPGPGSGLPVQA